MLYAFSRMVRWVMPKRQRDLKTVERFRTDRYIEGEIYRARTLVGSYLTCRKCGRTTHNPEDVMYKYCGGCHEWLDRTHNGLR